MSGCFLVTEAIPFLALTDGFKWLQVFEGGDSDNECSGGFGSSTVRPKGSTKAWSRSVQLGGEDQNQLPAVMVDNGVFNTSIAGRGRASPMWRDGRASPPMNTSQSEKNSNSSIANPRASTSSSKRTSLWGLAAVCVLHNCDFFMKQYNALQSSI
jgi:hypothetical protein